MNQVEPRIGLLMVGWTLPPIRERYGDFDQWFIARSRTAARFHTHHIHNGDPLPSPEESDGWIITGSPRSVYDQLPWLAAAKKALVLAVESDHPILGVCFGHQLLAAAIGSDVGPNPQGWEMGQTTISLLEQGAQSPLFAGMDSPFKAFATHRDVVHSLPDQVRPLASNDMGLQAFQAGERAFGVQFHPEFTADITRMYMQLRPEAVSADLAVPDAAVDHSWQVLANFIQLIIA